MKSKKNVLIIFGGRSVEHEVSVKSARNVVQALDKTKYKPLLVGITQDGHWLPCDVDRLLSDGNADTVAKLSDGTVTNSDIMPYTATGALQLKEGSLIDTIDVVFPILHGPMGEDGTIQGLLTLAQLPFVGADVLGSAVGMDKDVAKRLLHEAGLPIVPHQTYHAHQREEISFNAIKNELGLPFFVKPANAGSSVGVSKVRDEANLATALDEAFRYDTKILIEEYIPCREVECAVLGNEDPIASIPGDIVVKADFYSYEAKYLDENGAVLSIPTTIPKDLSQKVQELAIRAFKVLCCKGMARVDFFVTDNNRLFINEINTIPGFTSSSMYPKLWEHSGISYTDLISKLLDLALERFEQQKKLSSIRTIAS